MEAPLQLTTPQSDEDRQTETETEEDVLTLGTNEVAGRGCGPRKVHTTSGRESETSRIHGSSGRGYGIRKARTVPRRGHGTRDAHTATGKCHTLFDSLPKEPLALDKRLSRFLLTVASMEMTSHR